MRPLLGALVVLGVGCMPPPDCVARYGLAVYGSDACEEMGLYLDAAMGIKEPLLRTMSLDGWFVEVRPEPWYSEEHKYGINGVTYCWAGKIVMNEITWRESTFIHEMIHVRENCFERNHESWKARNIDALMVRAQEEVYNAVHN